MRAGRCSPRTSQDGVVEPKEMEQVMHFMGLPLALEDASALVHAVDRSG